MTLLTIALMIAFSGLPTDAAENLLVNGDFREGTGNQPRGWSPEIWMDRSTTDLTWIPPFANEPGELEIKSLKLNDARWIQSATLSPGLYYASAEIFTHAIPEDSWAGAFISIGDQGVASLDVKGNSNWTRRGVYFIVSRDRTKVEVKLRLAGLENFAVGQAFFRDAVLMKIEHAPTGALVLHLDASRRLWSGSHWTLVPAFLLLLIATIIGWRILGSATERIEH